MSDNPSLVPMHRPLGAYSQGVEDAISIIRERGTRLRGAIQPDRTEAEIRKRLLP